MSRRQAQWVFDIVFVSEKAESRIGGHHQFQLPLQHLPEPRRRLALRPLFPLERHDPSSRASDSWQLGGPLAPLSAIPDRNRTGDLARPRRHESDLCDLWSCLDPRPAVRSGPEWVGLGSGIFGYLGPQMLGYLRDSTGGFTAGWIFVAVAAVVSLADLLLLRAWSSRSRTPQPVAI